MTNIKKRYVPTSLGDIHLRVLAAKNRQSRVLLCLHPAPASGLCFETLMPLLNAERQVIAPDYPGYGGSVALTEPPTIATYATAMLETIAALDIDTPIDIMGFHSGCLVATEMALLAPETVRQLVLCDVPYFSADVQPDLREKAAKPLPLTTELECLEAAWKFNVSNRIGHVPMARAFELFAEQLRNGTRDYFCFDAAFRYACEERFPELAATTTTIIATQSSLLEPSRVAATVVPGATLIEAPEITTAVLEVGATEIAERILRVLDDNP